MRAGTGQLHTQSRPRRAGAAAEAAGSRSLIAGHRNVARLTPDPSPSASLGSQKSRRSGAFGRTIAR